jgi:hypothetical protein
MNLHEAILELDATDRGTSLAALLTVLERVDLDGICSIDLYSDKPSVHITPKLFAELFDEWKSEEYRPATDSVRRDAELCGFRVYAYFPCESSHSYKVIE